MVRTYGRKVTCILDFCSPPSARESLLLFSLLFSLLADEQLSPPVQSLQMLKICKTHHLCTYFRSASSHKEPLAAAAPSALDLCLKPPGSCFTITYPESSVCKEEA